MQDEDGRTCLWCSVEDDFGEGWRHFCETFFLTPDDAVAALCSRRQGEFDRARAEFERRRDDLQVVVDASRVGPTRPPPDPKPIREKAEAEERARAEKDLAHQQAAFEKRWGKPDVDA